jgi:uncharacterized protein (TIGR02001 family)
VLAIASRAAAEVRIAAAIASDDRFRGRSVSQGRPVATLDLSYDAANGVYAGVAATGVAARYDGAQLLAIQTYAGYARRLADGPTLDAGVTHLSYTDYYEQGGADYSELYAGVITPRFATHLYYSPNYFDRRESTLYGEVDTALRPAANWRLNLHAGLLTRLHEDAPTLTRPTQYDWRVGLARTLLGFEIELAGSGAGPDPDHYAGQPRGRAALVVAVRHAF